MRAALDFRRVVTADVERIVRWVFPRPRWAFSKPAAQEVFYRHRLPVRVTHWINALCILFLLGSGLNIFNAHPRAVLGKLRRGRRQAFLLDRVLTTRRRARRDTPRSGPGTSTQPASWAGRKSRANTLRAAGRTGSPFRVSRIWPTRGTGISCSPGCWRSTALAYLVWSLVLAPPPEGHLADGGRHPRDPALHCSIMSS